MSQPAPVAPTPIQTQQKAAPVGSSHSGLLQRKCACGQHTVAGGECEECRKKREGMLQRAAINAAPVNGVPPIVHDVLNSSGQPLDVGTRAFMEPRFGFDFSRVRVHADARAAESAQAVNALAYTVGHNVVFGTGQYAPGTNEGRRLLAHELTHVVQQHNGAVSGRAIPGGIAINEPNGAFERQADETASRLLSHPTSGVGNTRLRPLHVGAQNAIQRQAARQSRTAALSSRRAPIVEDGQQAGPGQMQRTEFLTILRDRLIPECEAELAPVGRSARGCPYILRTIERYSTRPVSSLLRLIQLFAHPPAGADANGLIEAVSQRTRAAARRLAASSGQRLQAMSESDNGRLEPHDPVTVRSQLGGGSLFNGPIRGQMEQSFGTSFSSVRIHTDAAATRLNAELGARAFTIGNDIAFAAGQYRPGTLPGDALIAHELAHTLQQSAGMPNISNAVADRELERQADRAAIAAVVGREGIGSSLQTSRNRIHIQRDGVGEVALAAILFAGEAGTDLAIADGAVVVVTDVAAPVALDVAAPVALDVAAPAALDVAAPAALDVTASAAAPTAIEAAAPVVSSSSALSTTTSVGVGVTAVAATTISSDSPTEEKRRRRCRPDPCDHPLPILWPTELPFPTISPRLLIRTSAADREWEGIDRGVPQRRMQEEIRRARDRLVPPPNPCFENDAEPNAPYDAHHAHPLYLGGEDAEYNLCSLETGRHQRGHRRLDNQSTHLPEYIECGICSAFLSQHPVGQIYEIVGEK